MFVSGYDYPSRSHVKKAYPDAYKIVYVEGGWYVFFYQTDYETWLKQK